MTLTDLFRQIESPRFAVKISVCSGFSSVLMTLNESPLLGELDQVLRGSEEARAATYRQLGGLLWEVPDWTVAHPHDHAILAYLYSLDHTDRYWADRAISGILSTPNLFWARRLAKHIEHGEAMKDG